MPKQSDTADEIVSVPGTTTAPTIEPAARDASYSAGRTADQVKADAADLAAKAGHRLKDAAATGKDMAADAVHGLAGAARDVAGRLADGEPDGPSAKAAGYARKAADSMDRFSESLKGKDLDEIADDARRAVRQHPAIAVGAAAVIGFALARFLKAGSGGDRNA